MLLYGFNRLRSHEIDVAVCDRIAFKLREGDMYWLDRPACGMVMVECHNLIMESFDAAEVIGPLESDVRMVKLRTVVKDVQRYVDWKDQKRQKFSCVLSLFLSFFLLIKRARISKK